MLKLDLGGEIGGEQMFKIVLNRKRAHGAHLVLLHGSLLLIGGASAAQTVSTTIVIQAVPRNWRITYSTTRVSWRDKQEQKNVCNNVRVS